MFDFKPGEIYYFKRKTSFLLCVGFDQNSFKFMNCIGDIHEWKIVSSEKSLLIIKPLFSLDS